MIQPTIIIPSNIPVFARNYEQLKACDWELSPCVFVFGRISDGDGGGGYFRFIPSSELTPKDMDAISNDPLEGIYVSSEFGYWKRVYSYGINPLWFQPNIIPGETDMSSGILSAIKYSKINGDIVAIPPGIFFYNTDLILTDGEKVRGTNNGENPLGNGSLRGTVLWYGGNGKAITLSGPLCEASGFTLFDKNKQATHGVYVGANNGENIDSPKGDIIINGFTRDGAYAFEANATNGGIAYGEFRVRARSCKNYFKIFDNNTGVPAPFGYVNSNNFLLRCSGGEIGDAAPEYGLYVEGGNNNTILPGSVLEPYQTSENHVRVVRGQISGKLRVEGQRQGESKPLVLIESGDSDLRFEPSTAHIVNKSRSAKLINLGSKSAQPKIPADNLYYNPEFFEDRNKNISGWSISGGVTFRSIEPQLLKGFRTLEITVPPGVVCKLSQPVPVINNSFDTVSHGAWVKVDTGVYPGASARALMFFDTGLTGGARHVGDGCFHYLGLSGKYNQVALANFANSIEMIGGDVETIFYVTCPALCFGSERPSIYGNENSRKIINTDLSTSHGGANELILPPDGDTFIISSSIGPKTIARINNSAKISYPGRCITLLFDQSAAGSTVTVSNYYIVGRANILVDQHTSIKLVSDKAGVWKIIGIY